MIFSKRALGLAALLIVAAGACQARSFGLVVRQAGQSGAERAAYIYSGGQHSVTVASGRPTLIYRFFVRCGLGSRPYISAVADHGAATTKDGTAAICGNSNEPVTELWYQSEPKFHGSDTITVLPYRVIFNVSIR